MGWHQSKSDPCRVYDSRHTAVARAETPELAALIVQAVNQMAAPKYATPANMWGAASRCCTARLIGASRSGVLDAVTTWECKDCGTEWQCTEADHVRSWRPYVAVMVMAGRK